MTLIDPTRTWAAVEARLATETDPTRAGTSPSSSST